ncbi:MAG: hydrogen peroxide-inducible genes activator [Oceanicaulis sp.]|jgi:LysR family hydrogen peroxide-inducible transcriptional activator|uniref:hydrogen peroxide-inducible genes activator n=1 Tax=unclassified Oceanicaulis TaxID=2632123 RepID=UPI000066979E|nr:MULTISPECIES: hydrogen peroxide-inducible genes activator [unclassified Oceanicaulis]EAP89532.1 transcriptional regulator, LysR family protein [Oceanicaulis sp. HTCC2633]MBC38795.1 hydrogen peroxide-inducible genes activator [Oceanicaulis sp.]MBG36236.1 hydrogen peroxide-inducible genes activator [Oceanicaulis sp.]HBU62345.1 hydrogen peroxide-inducible genes activator [Oceanicaulis sp.]HCR95774.1 hydrogen peroxide-inducible genes activator [Oceanicaulis sp.]
MSSHLPTLRQLTFLLALAEHGSFSRAAEAAHVTQPTLSAGIKELETILGATLVERGARGAALTPAGEAAVARARIVLTEAEDLVHVARAAGEPLSGPFRLGVIPTIAPFLLPKALPSLREHYPKLELFLREDLTHRLVEALKDRRLDAALIALPYDAPGIETTGLLEDEFLFAATPDHRLAKVDKLNPAMLADEPLLLLEDGHCLRDHALAVCSASKPDTNDARSDFAATSLHTLVQMVKSGLGATLLPKLAIDAGLADRLDLAIRPFDPPVAGREIGVAWRKGSAREHEARMLADAVREALKG